MNLTSNGVSKYGAKNTFSCSGTAAIDANSKLLLKWWHYRKHAGNGSTIEMTDKATKPVVETVGSNNVIKSKLDVVVSGGTAGTYQCDVIVQWLNSYEYHFRQNASLLGMYLRTSLWLFTHSFLEYSFAGFFFHPLLLEHHLFYSYSKTL